VPPRRPGLVHGDGKGHNGEDDNQSND
jgi:hypothetical protein